MNTQHEENPKGTLIHFLMGVHGFTKQGDEKAAQTCFDEAVSWFATLSAEHKKEMEEEREAIVRIAQCYMNRVDFENFKAELDEPPLTQPDPLQEALTEVSKTEV